MFRVWTVPAVALACALPWVAFLALSRVPARRAALEALFVGYLGALCYVVFYLTNSPRPGDASSAWAAVNLVPGSTMLEIVRESPHLVTLQLLDNVMLFLPLGFFLPLLGARWRRFVATAAAGLAVSALIELVQFLMRLAIVSRRAPDIDDVILNVTGACLGFLVWRGAFAPPKESTARLRRQASGDGPQADSQPG